MKTEAFIDRLARDAVVVKPLPTPAHRAGLWLLWAVAYLILASVVMRASIVTGPTSLTGLYLFQQLAALATGVFAARAAFVSVVPGARRAWDLTVACAVAWLGSLLWRAASDFRHSGTFGAANESDWPCVASMILGGLVIGAPLMSMLRRGAPMTPRATAFLAGLAALSVANIEACLTRPHAFAMTILLWHGVTLMGGALSFAVLGRLWLRWPRVHRT
jgi:hypothetical protein